MSFGDRLLEARTAKGWTLDELADKVKLTAPYLSKIENEKVLPAHETLTEILQKLEADPTDAVAERDKEELKRLGRDPEVADVFVDVELLTPEQRARVLGLVREVLAELEQGEHERVLEHHAAPAR